MNMRNIVWGTVAVGALLAGGAVFAKDSVKTPNPAAVSCVATAVSTREAALGTAVSTQETAIKNAYSVRASSLATAYTKTTIQDIRAAVKAAWSQFGITIKSSGASFRTAKNTAWSQFKASAKACKDTTGASDGDNSLKEVSGQ